MTRRSRQLTAATLLLVLAVAHAAPAPAPSPRLPDEDTLQPLQEAGGGGAGASLAGEDAALAGDELARDKRKLEAVTQAKFSVKNALLGFVFGKINSLIDAKTRLIDTLDRQNIEKNKAYGIEAPASGLGGLGSVVSQVIGPKLQLLGPKISAVSGLVSGASGGGGSGGALGSGGGTGGGAGSGGGLGSILSLVTSLSGSSSGGGGAQGATVDTVDDDDDDDAR